MMEKGIFIVFTFLINNSVGNFFTHDLSVEHLEQYKIIYLLAFKNALLIYPVQYFMDS